MATEARTMSMRRATVAAAALAIGGAGCAQLGGFLRDQYEQSKANAYQQGYQAGRQSQ